MAVGSAWITELSRPPYDSALRRNRRPPGVDLAVPGPGHRAAVRRGTHRVRSRCRWKATYIAQAVLCLGGSVGDPGTRWRPGMSPAVARRWSADCGCRPAIADSCASSCPWRHGFGSAAIVTPSCRHWSASGSGSGRVAHSGTDHPDAAVRCWCNRSRAGWTTGIQCPRGGGVHGADGRASSRPGPPRSPAPDHRAGGGDAAGQAYGTHRVGSVEIQRIAEPDELAGISWCTTRWPTSVPARPRRWRCWRTTSYLVISATAVGILAAVCTWRASGWSKTRVRRRHGRDTRRPRRSCQVDLRPFLGGDGVDPRAAL